MQDRAEPANGPTLAIRLGIGFAQGLTLYALQRWRAELEPAAAGAFQLTAYLLPIVALGAFGQLGRRTMGLWLAVTAALTLGLGAYANFVRPPNTNWIAPQVAVFVGVALFILHQLILGAEAEGRWRAPYRRYFDASWRDAVRLGLGVAFAGVLWLLLLLGAALFHLIGLEFLRELIRKSWFSWPVMTTSFALAIHLTDVRAALVLGARTLALTLFSWLLPVFTLIAAGFLLALPFTGLGPLLATRSATGVMLSSCAVLVILINATYQDGEHDGFPPTALKWVTRAAALALAPLVTVAAYGLALRIAQHGLTPRRIYALACLAVAVCYAMGYVWAAVSRGRWMGRLEATNWITAQVVVVVLVTIFSPLLDPARISVASQVRRLESGRIAPKDFDFDFLRFRSGRWGMAALGRLAAGTPGPRGTQIAQLAQAQLKRKLHNEPVQPTLPQRAASIQAVGGPLPPGFLTQSWTAQQDPARECMAAIPGRPAKRQGCVAMTADLDGRQGPEVIVFSPFGRRVFTERDGRWMELGTLYGVFCNTDSEAMLEGRLKFVPPLVRREIEIDGHRLVLVPDAAGACPPAGPAQSPTAETR